MKLLCLLSFLVIALNAHAVDMEVVALASIDLDRVAASGLKVEHKTDMPDFTVTYLHGPEPTDVIGIYEGGHPSTFCSQKKQLGKVKGIIAEKPVEWVCWTEERNAKKLYGSEVLFPSRRITVPGQKTEVTQEFHVWVFRSDLKSLAAARRLVSSLFRTEPSSKRAQSSF